MDDPRNREAAARSAELQRESRLAARLVLLDDEGRVLLFRHVDGRGGVLWATPGGGLEEGETPEQAARREASEELGVTDVALAPLWTGTSTFAFGGALVTQTETFFLVTRHAEILGARVAEQHRVEGIAEIRWWHLDEIRASVELISPIDLATRLEALTGKRSAATPDERASPFVDSGSDPR